MHIVCYSINGMSSEQIKTVSGIFANLGHIFFASIVIPFVVSPADGNMILIFFGVATALLMWSISIIILTK